LYKKPCLISPRKLINSNNSINNSGKQSENLHTDESKCLDEVDAQLETANSGHLKNPAKQPSPSASSGSYVNAKSLTILIRNNSNDECMQMREPSDKELINNGQRNLYNSHQQSKLIESADSNNTILKYNGINETTMNSEFVRNSLGLNMLSQLNYGKSASITGPNISGYLWKLKDISNNQTSSGANDNYTKYWFNLNTNMCCLTYWNDKHEQDIGKFPIGKYELYKCCQIVKDWHTESNTNASSMSRKKDKTQTDEVLEFKINFHQNSSSIHFKANNIENKVNWCDALKHTIENIVCCLLILLLL
jgi:hypothetical protein